jgi:hypothetical protein
MVHKLRALWIRLCGLIGARRQALIRLGGAEQTRQAYRERRTLPWLETLLQDIRFGLRILCKNPGYTAVAVLTLALGIGANTAVFTVAQAALLRSWPAKEPATERFSAWKRKRKWCWMMLSLPTISRSW